MPVLLKNAYVDTTRSLLAGGQTGPPQTYLTNVACHISAASASDYLMHPAALESDYIVAVETGTDIVAGDRISNIRRNDLVTVWPGAALASDLWAVVHVRETAPGPLMKRNCYVKRMTLGGPAVP